MTTSFTTVLPLGTPWYRLLKTWANGHVDHAYAPNAEKAYKYVNDFGYSWELRGSSFPGATGWLLPEDAGGSSVVPLYYKTKSWSSLDLWDSLYTTDRSEGDTEGYTLVETAGYVWSGRPSGDAGKVAVPVYRSFRTFSDGTVDHFYSSNSQEGPNAGYTRDFGNDPAFYVLPARTTFLMGDDGRRVVAGPRFDGYQDGDVVNENDQTACWVRPPAISTWTFGDMTWKDGNGVAIAQPSMMRVNNALRQATVYSQFLDDRDQATVETTYSYMVNTTAGSIDPRVVNKPAAGVTPPMV